MGTGFGATISSRCRGEAPYPASSGSGSSAAAGGPLPQLAWGEYGPRHHGLTCPGLVTRGLCCGVRKPSTQSHNEEGRS